MGTSEMGISEADGLLVEENCMVLEFTGGDNKQVTLGKLESHTKELTLDSRIPHFRGVRHWHFHANPDHKTQEILRKSFLWWPGNTSSTSITDLLD
jgi:hypothetical protein